MVDVTDRQHFILASKTPHMIMTFVKYRVPEASTFAIDET